MVEPDPLLLHLSAEVLIRQGYVVNAAEDAATAWEELQAINYHLLITNYKLPKITRNWTNQEVTCRSPGPAGRLSRRTTTDAKPDQAPATSPCPLRVTPHSNAEPHRVAFPYCMGLPRNTDFPANTLPNYSTENSKTL
jgi:hypothetical protein